MYSPTACLSPSPSIIPSALDVPRRPPPVRPSRSLDGLEQVVPPTGLAYYPCHSHSRSLPPSPPPRSDLRLNKPLPPRPPPLAPETVLAPSAQDKDQTQAQTHVHSQLYSPSTTATSTSITLSEDSLASSVDYSLGPRHEGDKSQDWDHDQTQRSHSAVVVEAVPIGLKPEVIEVQLRQAEQQQQQHENQTRRSVSFSGAIFYHQVLEDSDEETAIEDDSIQTAAPAGTKEDDSEADEEEERKVALTLKAFVSEELYGRHVHFLPHTWSGSGRIATSHYFREKKWDFFPELAMPSQLQMEKMPRKWGPFMATTANNNGTKMTDKYRGKIKGTVHGFRDSIKYFHLNRKLMKEAACSGLAPWSDEDVNGVPNGNRDEKEKLAEKPPSRHSRVVTVSSSISYSSPRLHDSFTSSSASSSRDEPQNDGSWESPGRPYRHRGRRSDTCDGELETGSTSEHKTRTESGGRVNRRSDGADEAYGQQRLTPRTHGRTSSTNLPKQRAVPLSPYQKYGPAIWESHKSPRKRHVRFARTHRRSSSASSSVHSSTGESQSTAASSVDDSGDSYYRMPPPPKPPYRAQSKMSMKTTANGRGNRGPSRKASQVLEEAKKMITESKADRRREELKAQIKLVGPLNAHTFYRREEWY